MTLVEFLEARLAEDELIAGAAIEGTVTGAAQRTKGISS
jgi:hypothetical protein